MKAMADKILNDSSSHIKMIKFGDISYSHRTQWIILKVYRWHKVLRDAYA
jgi:hypothetical protein